MLEIEFESDDQADAQWLDSSGDPAEGPARRRLRARRLVGLRMLLAVLVPAVAATAGLHEGRIAAYDRGVSAVRLASADPLIVEALPIPSDAPAYAAPSREPWTGDVDRTVTLKVVNRGPDPVTLISAVLTAPHTRPSTLLPATTAGEGVLRPGAEGTLTGPARFNCGVVSNATLFHNPATMATVARLSVHTADGALRHEELLVDPTSQLLEQSVCERLPGPQTVGGTVFTALPPGAASYLVTVSLTNRAPFPLRAVVDQSSADLWPSSAGLSVSLPEPVILGPGAAGQAVIRVNVVDCALALSAAKGHFAYGALEFSDARSNDWNAPSAGFVANLRLAEPSMVDTVCG